MSRSGKLISLENRSRPWDGRRLSWRSDRIVAGLREEPTPDIAISDIDLGKNSCSPAGLDTLEVVLRRRTRRSSFRNLPKDQGVALRR
jgi:hypothetical protein